MLDNFSILTVCTGNVCRSPLAEQLLFDQLRGIPEIHVSSAGTHALVGHPMFDATREIARSLEIENTDDHRARQMTEDILESADLILTMTRDHRRSVVEISPRVTRRVFTIREFARLAEVTTDEILSSEMNWAKDSPAERLRGAVTAVAVGRSVLPPVTDPAEDDVIDPYRRDMKVHTASAQQLVPAVTAAARLLRRSVEGPF